MFTISLMWACVMLSTGEPVCHSYSFAAGEGILLERRECAMAGQSGRPCFRGHCRPLHRNDRTTGGGLRLRLHARVRRLTEQPAAKTPPSCRLGGPSEAQTEGPPPIQEREALPSSRPQSGRSAGAS